jgi:Type I phosphodiesterase / nucleotide pyrophosphatase
VRPNIDREVRSLLAPDPKLGVPVPAYSARSLPNVTSSVVRSLGREVSGDPPLLPTLAEGLDPFEGRRAEGPIVVLLVDGMGFSALTESTGGAALGVPSEWVERARPITSVFPTTTTVALTSLSTAEPPSRHGVVGYRMFLPSFGVVAEVLRMTPLGVPQPEALVKSEWSPSMVSGVPSIFRRGVTATALSHDEFEGTGFTRMIYDGASYTGFTTAADFAHQLAEVLGPAEPPSLVFAYWSELDTVQHLRGPRPEFTAFEAAQVHRILAAALRRLDPSTGKRTTVLVTSDHGQVPAERKEEVAIDAEPTILPHLLRPPTGDRRAGFFTARPGHLEPLKTALEDRLPPGSRILSMPTAISAGLFGPPPYHPELSERLGDLLVLVPSPAAVTYRLPGTPARARFLLGAHGGLEPEELIVPMIAGTLAELGRDAPSRSSG